MPENYFFVKLSKEIKMHLNKIVATASLMLAATMAMAASTSKAVDLNKLHGRFEKAGYSSLDLIEATKEVLISGVVLAVSESFSGGSILKVGVRANSQELARLSAADDAQEDKLNALQPGAKFKAVCDLAFSSGTKYMSFQNCVFK